MTQLTYALNERVLCYHGPLIYEAKILKTEDWDESNTRTGEIGPHFFVHYKGWKHTWDEWVPASRLLKHDETNISLQKGLIAQSAAAQAAVSAKAKANAAGTSKDTGSSRTGRKDGRGTKRGREEDENGRKPEIKLSVPEVIKVMLVDDWEAITKNNQLVPIPRSPTVAEILQKFKDHVLANPKTSLHQPSLVLPTIISGLQVYFDRSLGANLLYRFERPQYAEVRKQFVTGPSVVVGTEKDMSSIYGGEHLIRMLVSLPQMISNSTMDAESAALVRDYVNELFLFLVKERNAIFVSEYQSASLGYQNISRS